MNDQDWIYLDYNASTTVDDRVIEAMASAMKTSQAHPSSPHPEGRRAAQTIAEARTSVAESLGAQSDEIIFCSGSTEASNHVIKGVAFAKPSSEGPLHFISSRVDHAATLEPLKFLESLGHQVTLLDVDEQGRFSPEQLTASLRGNTVLVTLIHGQNEVGTVQPLEEIGEICRQRDVLFHVDASQSFGKIPFSVDSLNADFLNIAGHKIYGPKGVGALYVRSGRRLEPLLHGGGHESGWRSGTPAAPLAAGLAEACRLQRELGPISSQATEAFWDLLSSKLGSKVRRNGCPQNRLPNVCHLNITGAHGRELLNRAQISASTGAACHSSSVSPVLAAMGFKPEEALGSIRFSFGRQTTVSEASQAAHRIEAAHLACSNP